MNTVEDGKKFIDVGTQPLESVNISLYEASGYANSADIFAPMDFPDFEQSAMDGYGIFLDAHNVRTSYRVSGEEQTGNITIQNKITPDEALRIFTGAKVPAGINTIIQQEWVQRVEDKIIVKDFPITLGMNIRPKGSQTKCGDLVLKKGSPLSAASVSLLAGLGLAHLNVFRKPRIIIINTGKELVSPGEKKQSGQVYESNSFSLHQALAALHINPIEIATVDDDKEALIKKFGASLSACDLLLITGGVSVGDYDFVVDALNANHVEQVFHQLSQKPGKPLYFGKKGNTSVFGLPGNPASVLTSFYLFVIPCIKKMMGFAQNELTSLKLPLLCNYTKKPGLTHFIKGKIREGGVELLSDQESYKMNSFAVADVLIEVDRETTHLQLNDTVKVYLLPL